MEGTSSEIGSIKVGGEGRCRRKRSGIKGYISFKIRLPLRLNLSENPAYCSHDKNLKATFARDLEA